jgi:hypothetical protein
MIKKPNKKVDEFLSMEPSGYYYVVRGDIEGQNICHLLYQVSALVAQAVGVETAKQYVDWITKAGIHDLSDEIDWCRKGLKEGEFLKLNEINKLVGEFYRKELREQLN